MEDLFSSVEVGHRLRKVLGFQAACQGALAGHHHSPAQESSAL